jgi:hypothetical protein
MNAHVHFGSVQPTPACTSIACSISTYLHCVLHSQIL